MISIDCPYCLASQPFLDGDCCDSCHARVPREYIEVARIKPPLWIVTFGYTDHGKSDLLSSITYLVEQLGAISPRAYYTYLDEHTREQIAARRRLTPGAKAPEEAPLRSDVLAPLLIALRNFPRDQDTHVLVVIDLPGAAIETMASSVAANPTTPPLYAKALAKAKPVWFVVSLYDLQKDLPATGRSLSRLFWSYHETLGQLNAPPQKRSVLVAYTKADYLHAVNDVNVLVTPPAILDYLDNDPFCDLGPRNGAHQQQNLIGQYLPAMKDFSNQLHQFTLDCVPGGLEFVTRVEDEGVDLHFVISSALEGPCDPQGVIETRAARRCVLDALLWTLELADESRAALNVAVVLPASSGKRSVAGLERAVHLALAEYKLRAATYYLGEARKAFPAGEFAGHEHPLTEHAALLGAILERLPAKSIAIVLVDGALPLDIDDFAVTSWDERLLVLGVGTAVLSARVRWKYQVQSVHDVELAVREFSPQIEKTRARLP